jgi:hypothetical protein
MADPGVRFTCFPSTEPPPHFVAEVAGVFKSHESAIGTYQLPKGLTSDAVLEVLRDDLTAVGFEVEASKRAEDKIERPVFFGENGEPTLRYEIDAYHAGWRCGMEIEAGRAWMGNAVYRDLVQALVMVEVDTLLLAVPNVYKFKSGGREAMSADYAKTVSVAQALYGHSRMRLPYRLAVIGY